jgi:hypothetical protein
MKKVILILFVIIIQLAGLFGFSQVKDEPIAIGLPGDNLNLYAVLEVFQKSKTLEEFERAINDKDSKSNNLDLNDDKQVDYIEVVSNKVGNAYSIVLRTAINDKEYQDIAVIEVNKNKSDKIIIQIIGDEELYGKNYILEPSGKEKAETPNPGYVGNNSAYIDDYGATVYYVNDWPIIVHLFSPAFVLYVSPWHWGFYPTYWYPWVPIYYYNYWGYHSHYYHSHYYRRATHIRYPVHYSTYTTRRNISSSVTRIRSSGRYDSTYEGRTFRRPESPNRKISPSTTRPVSPLRKANPSRTILPNQRQTAPTRMITPTPRQTPRQKQIAPSRTIIPSQRQSAPTRQPANQEKLSPRRK